MIGIGCDIALEFDGLQRVTRASSRRLSHDLQVYGNLDC